MQRQILEHARYIVAMSKGTNFHSTEIMMVHDGTSVDITEYGTLSDATRFHLMQTLVVQM